MQKFSPNRPAAPPSPQSPFVRRKSTKQHIDLNTVAARPTVAGSVVLIIGLVLTGLVVGSVQDPPHFAAMAVGASLILSVLMDLSEGGPRNLIRADVFALMALYFLTLFEFAFPQDDFETLVSRASVIKGIILCLWGFAGIAIGRHISTFRSRSFSELFVRPVPTTFMLGIFWFSFVIGYFHMLLAVNFNVFEVFNYWIEPRFAQPWQRGRLGDWKALMIELGLFLYLIPPLAGIIFARRSRYSSTALFFVGVGCLITLFYGFSSGTRNIFASYLLTFLIGYAFAMPQNRKKELYILTGSCAFLLLISTVIMLEFRSMGLKAYAQGQHVIYESVERRMHVDYNLYAISQLAEVFPRRHPFLGWEVPYIAIVRPIPRAIWKGKPEGLSLSIEDAVGAEGWTVAASFIGEAYIAGGTLIVFLTGAIFGVLMGWWGQLASPRNSEFGILVYASGFFAVGISMRSVFSFTTAILPTFGALVIGAILIKKVQAVRHDAKQQREANKGFLR